MTEYSERDLVLPTLAFLERAPAGLTTSRLISLLTEALAPDGPDAEILARRRDSHFSQKVRNLVSHRTLAGPGLVVYDAPRQLHRITEAGLAYLAGQTGRPATEQRPPKIGAAVSGTIFGGYRRVDETRRQRERVPFEVDPDAVDRSTIAHATVQNALADWVVSQGLTPLSSAGGLAEFDLAWEDGATLHVVEVKSLTAQNETKQLRLGLGQVLHYRALLETATPFVRPILAVEREPTDGRWVGFCRRLGVTLVWPTVFERLLERKNDTGTAHVGANGRG